MLSCKYVSNINEIAFNNEWVPATKFNSKDRFVDDKGNQVASNYQGRQYYLIDKRERTFSNWERVGRGFLGVLGVISIFSLIFFFKRVKDLFTKSKETIRVAVLVTPEQRKTIEDFTPEMVRALGGVDKVLNLPIIEGWQGEIHQKDLKAPIMRGYLKEGPPFLLFSYFKWVGDKYKITGEYLGRQQKGSWEGAYSYPGELNLRSPNPIADGSLEAKYMLNKICRLTKGEAIGAVEQFPNVILMKPADKNSFLPTDAYLEGEELLKFMDLDTNCYEKKPREGTTELFLYDPRLLKQENKELLLQKFPNSLS